MAIRTISGPVKVSEGIFKSPVKFDASRLAPFWVLESEVDFKRQTQPVSGTNMEIDGLEVWKNPDDGGKPFSVATKRAGKFILMFRTRAEQAELNKIYGDVGKRSITQEKSGTTVAGMSPEQAREHGLLGEKVLSQLAGLENAGMPPIDDEITDVTMPIGKVKKPAAVAV